MIHWSSFAVAVGAGAWVAVNDPAERLFEQAARAAGLTGAILTPAASLYDATVIFLAASVSYAVAALALRAVASRRP